MGNHRHKANAWPAALAVPSALRLLYLKKQVVRRLSPPCAEPQRDHILSRVVRRRSSQPQKLSKSCHF